MGDNYEVNAFGQFGQAIGRQENYFIGAQPRIFLATPVDAAALAAVSGTPVILASALGDGEAASLVVSLKATLDRAGWDVNGPMQMVWQPAPPNGVLLRCMDAEAPHWVQVLGQMLLDHGLWASGETGCDENAIYVGTNVPIAQMAR